MKHKRLTVFAANIVMIFLLQASAIGLNAPTALTSYTFIQKCGACHPGGGSAEFDRNGNRYDKFATDPKNNITPGGQNEFDGDYFKAKWVKSGVLETDCLMCHLKDYNNEKRKNQITALNFRWSATAGTGFGGIKGSVSSGEKPQVSYNLSIFQEDGKVALPIIRGVQNENCLFCHSERDWKKRGASFNSRTDVHIRAGLRCIDCHVTGSYISGLCCYSSPYWG